MVFTIAVMLAMQPSEADTLKKRGFEVLEQIRREYYLPKSKLYCESIDSNGKKSGPSFNWGAGVMLSALNAAARLDPKYKKWLHEYADASRVYWNDKGPVPGYDVLPCPKPVDRYYDDNAWMVLALVETYEILGDKKYLNWASEALDYVLSGWDEKLGGGIYWRESDKKSKNTCSNAPAAAACLAVARYRNKGVLVFRAYEILEWTRKHLQDPSDLLLWDNRPLEGNIDTTKWSYNTGLYLRAWSMLEKAGTFYRPDFSKIAVNSLNHWIHPNNGGIKDPGRFAHLWLEGLAAVMILDPNLPTPEVMAFDYVWTKCRNPQGRFGGMWDQPFDPKQTTFELIDQASVARAFLFAANQSVSK